MFKELPVRLVLMTFIFLSIGPLPDVSAQSMIDLPAPGTMVDFSPKFNQATLKGIIFHPQNPFKFDFILDEGDASLNEEQLKAQSQKIAAYFLASLTTPEKEIWVNLSPFEKSRIIPTFFGNTLMGQNLLAQDYMLKQIMATALYPQRELGKEFWQKVYEQALIKFGTTNIPIDTFNKVWIVPDKAVVYENPKMNAVFVAESSLKVMLEQDYLAQNKNKFDFKMPPIQESVANTMSAAVIKELVVPALEKEVNEGKNFAPLRQVYNALILAKWYKDNLKNNVIAKGYVDRRKIKGVDSHDKQMISGIYRQYLKAYKKGVFNFIKEDFDEASQTTVPRKYFSGGFMGAVNVSRAMTAPRITRAFIAGVLLTVTVSSALAPSLLAQQSPQQTVLGAIGNQPAVPAVNLTADQKKNLLKIIKETSEGKGNPQAATEALQQIPDVSTVEYDADILRLNPGGSWDKPLNNLLSNSAGPGVNVPGGFSAPVAVTNLGLAQSIGAIVRVFRERGNVGNDTLRLEAAFDLMRKADQIKKGSGAWQKLTKKGTYESLVRPDPDDTVMAARFLTQAIFIMLGIESRTLAGGTAIAGLELVEGGLRSKNWIVRYSALAVLDAIKPGDPDNRYQGIIARFLQQPADQTTDIVTFEMAAGIAGKHGMVTVLPNMMQNMETFFKARPIPEDMVGSENWHAHMQALMQLAIKLSNGNKNVLIANLDAMAGRLTASGATDTLNSFYLGFLFAAVQSGDISLADFIDQLNGLRTRYGLGKVSDVRVGPQARNAEVYLTQLKNGLNVDQNVSNIVVQGGPLYFPDLLGIFKETNDLETVKAVLDKLPALLSMGMYPRNNSWIAAIDEKDGHPNPAIREAVTAYALNNTIGKAVARALANPNDRVAFIRVLQGLTKSGAPSKDYLPLIVRGIFSQHNPVFDPTENGQTASFREIISLAAQVIAKSTAEESELGLLIAGNTTPDETSALTGRQLESAVAAIKDGRDPRTAMEQASRQEWVYAEKIFLNYLRGENGVTPDKVAAAIETAYRVYKKPSDPSSGDTITERLMGRYVTNPIYRSPTDMIKMAGVFSKFQDKDFGYELLSGLLNSHFPQVDETVLNFFQQANTSQKLRASSQIVETYLFWFKNRNLENPDSVNMEVRIAQKVRVLGNALGEAVTNRLPTVSEEERRALLGLGLRSIVTAQTPRPALPGDRQPAARYSYTEAIKIIFDPNADRQKLLTTLNSMAGPFPSTAFDDLNKASKLPAFNDPDISLAFTKVMAAVQAQLGKGVVSGEKYQALRDQYLKAFQDAPGGKAKAVALDLFWRAPPEIAGDLFWEGINYLQQYYDMKDPQQRTEFFTLLKTMRYIVNDLRNKDKNKFDAIVGYTISKLQGQGPTRRFDNGIQYIFLRSIDEKLAERINLGIEKAGDNHLLNSPKLPPVTLIKGGQDIPKIYINLASRLNTMIKGPITSFVRNQDPLAELEKLFDPSDQTRQMAAIKNLGEGTLLFLDKIPLQGDAQTYLLYHVNQFRVSGNNPKIILPYSKISSPQDRILFMGQLVKRGTDALNQARQYLQDEELFTYHPEAVNELVVDIGRHGSPDMIEPLLQLYVNRDLTPYKVFGYGFQGNFIGSNVERAVVEIGKRNPDEVISRIKAFQNALPLGLSNTSNIQSVFSGLKDDISRKDKAMINGGIDLEGVNVQSQGKGDVKTAFDDPAQLAILIKADGLIPIIEHVKPLTQSAVNQLLGTI